MLDLNQLIKQQNNGNQVMATLGEDETVIISNYALMAAQGLIQTGRQRNEPIANIVLNAFRNGICLGIGIKIINGTIQERSK